MSKLKNTKKKLQSKIEGVKKLNDDLETKFDNVADSYTNNIPSTEDFVGKKLDALKEKRAQKKENKKDIFADMLEIVEQFLGTEKKSTGNQTDVVQSGTTINPIKNKEKKRITQHAISANETTLSQAKEVVIKRLSEALFLGEGICGTESVFNIDAINIKPEEFDVLDILTIDPETSCGQIIYEPKSPDKNKEKVNRELYTSFSGGSYTFTSNNNKDLFTSTWSVPNQHYEITGLTQGASGITKVQDFIMDYYSSIEMPEASDVAKTAMLLTIQGGGNCGKSKKFDLALNNIDRLLKKLLSVCGGQTNKEELKNQNAVNMFDESEEDIEFYFDFDDVEGIDIDDEDLRYRRVLRFKDCYNFEIDVDDTHIEDFIYLIKNKDPKQAVNETLNKVATDASEQSGGSLSISDLLNNLLNNFILSLPKALIMSVLSAKIFLPLIMLYKIFKQGVLNVVINIKELMKKFYKAISLIIKDLFWIFIRAFWELVRIDLIAFIRKLVQKIIKRKYKRYLLIITSLLALLRKLSETEIDSCYEIFQTILDTITGAINMKTPLNVPSFLLFVADFAPGYSQDRAFLNILERLESAGVPTGPIYGEDNDVLSLVKSVIDGHTEEEDTNSFVKIVLKGGVLPGPTGGAVIPPGVLSGVGKKF
jgi:hypothetical protein